ncbi:hypothetical protein OF83DRAFT_370070 [Amylostereum chailletii]|nr:hypothetical protein OF83DRAFT_370070 [Amylostereum chailletii]
MKLLALPLLATAVTHVLGTHVQAHPSSRSIYGSLSPSAKKVFDESMDLNEKLWDEAEGYLYALDSSGIHDTRASAMYATALLARAGGNGADVARAVRIIDAVAGEQYDINGTLWFGTYPHTPQDPFPGTSLLGAVPYASYDPNWRDFVATAWVLALEESRSLLSNDTVATLEQSLLKAGKGILLRYQGRGPYANSVAVNTSVDNADAAYTNPWLMGTLVMSYIGHRLNDTQLIKKSNEDAQAVYNLFTFGGFNTFSEYNSATYTGVDLWALSLWITYGPKGTKLKEYGSYMLNHTLLDLADLYHADLRNLAGPWDRSYGFDMTRYHSIFGEVVTALAPLDKGAIPSPPASGLHLNDASCFGPLIPLVADRLKNAAPPGVLESFSAFRKERTVARKVRTNVVDETAVRNFTAWLGANISIGGISMNLHLAKLRTSRA